MAKKLSELVEQYANQQLEEDPIVKYLHAIGRGADSEKIRIELRQKAWVLILDELSEELLKLAGNGLPIQGQRRIADRLGIPRDKAE